MLSAACSAEVTSYTPDADQGSTHAVVVVERSNLGGEQGSNADALAQFAKVPAETEPAAVWKLAGTALELPPVGSCQTGSEFAESSTALSTLGTVEFLEAGDVTVRADGVATALAPHALPAVGAFASGVVYATRDRSVVLPASASYTVVAQGSAALPGLEIRAEAPRDLEGVTVGGIPFADLSAIAASEPLDVTWNVGQAGDIVYLELLSQDARLGVVCAFDDGEGSGTLPAELITVTGPARLTVHRVRSMPFGSGVVHGGELRFDFEVGTGVDIAEALALE